MRIESGPTRERKVRTSITFLLVVLMAVWFAYDGLIGYPAKNKAEHLEQLTPEEREQAGDVRICERVAKDGIPAAKEAIRPRDLARQREALEKLYGEPPSFEGVDAWYYFGPAYRMKFILKRGRLDEVIGQKAQKAAYDIWIQQALATGLGVVALFAGWHLVRVVRTRLVLDEQGLVYRGRGPIGWDAMKALQTASFRKKGWVDLIYEDRGAERRLRLDEYHVAKFDEVMDEMCARKGFENPLPAEEDKEPS